MRPGGSHKTSTATPRTNRNQGRGGRASTSCAAAGAIDECPGEDEILNSDTDRLDVREVVETAAGWCPAGELGNDLVGGEAAFVDGDQQVAGLPTPPAPIAIWLRSFGYPRLPRSRSSLMVLSGATRGLRSSSVEDLGGMTQ
jgi:hypothetical protein